MRRSLIVAAAAVAIAAPGSGVAQAVPSSAFAGVQVSFTCETNRSEPPLGKKYIKLERCWLLTPPR